MGARAFLVLCFLRLRAAFVVLYMREGEGRGLSGLHSIQAAAEGGVVCCGLALPTLPGHDPVLGK